MTVSLLERPTAEMYGVGHFLDLPHTPDYDPWAHADALGAQLKSNLTLPASNVAAYSPDLHTIFFRPDLSWDVERCAIAHEIVHFENRDSGKSPREELRANRISTLRLIRPSQLARVHANLEDLAAVARELGVTESVMYLYACMARDGNLPRRQ